MIGLYYKPPNSRREIEEQICKEITDSSKKNRVVIVGDFNFPNIDWDSHSIRGLDGEKFVECIQEEFLIQYVDGLTREGAKLDLLLGNKEEQMTKVRYHFGTSDHNSISFKIAMENDRSGPKVKILNWGKANFDGIRIFKS